jgi:hypothetical protein
MPDWAKEIRAAIAPLNLDPMREAEVVEELNQHLRDRYDEMLAGGTGAEQAYHSLLRELNDGTLVAGLKASLQVAHAPLPVGKDEKEGLFTGIWNDLRFGAPAAEKSGVRDGGNPDCRARHRREYDHLPTAGCSTFAHPAGKGSATAGHRPHSKFPSVL